MTDSQERKANDSNGPRTINIEIPMGCFEGMFRTMTGRSDSGKSSPGCCEMMPNRCCPPPREEEKQEFVIVVKKKE